MDIKNAEPDRWKEMANIKFGQDRNAARKNKGQGLTVQEIELTPDDLIQKFSDHSEFFFLLYNT